MRKQYETNRLGDANYRDARNCFPPGNTFFNGANGTDLRGSGKECEAGGVYCGTTGWAAFVLPLMEQNALYEQIDFTKRAYANYCVHANAYGRSSGTECGDVANKEAGTRAPAALSCPSCPQTAAKGTQKDYCVNGGAELPERASTDGYAPIQANIDNQRGPFIGLFWANSGCGMQSIADGASHTFLAMELSSVTLPNATKVGDSANPFILVGRWSDGYGVFTRSGATDIPLNRLAYRVDDARRVPSTSAA
ncbi:MAG: DUF1559 domain-containing protein [Thermoguttaceae bacterium]|nr:DUF1559 domain-containing protein [Thermoguttaceae bacterium]